MKPQYEPQNMMQALGYLVEEAGEVQAALRQGRDDKLRLIEYALKNVFDDFALPDDATPEGILQAYEEQKG